jgi:O-antigen/teichoic acid export membrane protein
MLSLNRQNKQVVLLYFSTLLAVLLGVASSIINTRSIDPVSYGDVRYVQNIINFMASLLLFGYFLSGSRLLALSQNEEKSREIRGCMVVILFVTAFILVLGLIISYFFHCSKPTLATLFIVSLPVCFNPLLGNYINTTAQGDNHIVRLSAARLLPAFIYVPLAYWFYKTYGATSSRMILLQWGVHTIVAVLIIFSTHPSFKNLKATFKKLNRENKQYGIQLYYGSLVMVATNYIAGIMLGVFDKDNTNVGFYTLALTVTGPLAMLPSIIGTTYFKKFATLNRIPPRVLKMTLLMTFGSCVLFVLLIQPIVKLLYTETYARVGVYASWLAVGFCIHGIGDMINRYLGSHGQGKSIRNSSIINGIFKIFGFTVLVYLFDIAGALFTNVLCSTIYCLVLVYYYRKFVNRGTIQPVSQSL